MLDLSGDVGYEITAEKVNNYLKRNKGDIRIKINSPGGSVFEGFEIFNSLKKHPGSVTVEVGALAASAASYIMLAADRIEVNENSTVMIHRAWNLAIGNAVDMRQTADILDGIDNIIAKEYEKRTGVDKAEILEEMTADKWMIGAEQIIDANFADEITETTAEDQPEAKENLVAMVYGVKEKLRADAARDNQIAAKVEKVAEIMQNANTTAETNVVDDGNKLEEEDSDMKLSEFLEKNPEERAEYESSIKAAGDKAAAEEIKAAVEAERNRILEIVDISDSKITDAARETIDGGGDAKDYAYNERMQNRAAGSTAPAAVSAPQEPSDSAVDTAEIKAKKEAEAFSAAAKDFLKRQGVK